MTIADAELALCDDEHIAVGPGGGGLGGAVRWMLIEVSAAALGVVGWARWRAGLTADVAEFEPDYLKPFVPTQPRAQR
jgi:hypothetical protein